MNLYAVRDRLIDYFMQPFTGSDDKSVKAAMASAVNSTEKTPHGIKEAPHHFELWRLAEINTETGKVTGNPEFLCDCSSLVRGDIRDPRTPGAPESPAAAAGGQRTLGTPPGYGGTHERAPTEPVAQHAEPTPANGRHAGGIPRN